MPCTCAALEIRPSPGRGRGVFAACTIPSRSLLTVSPVLFFDEAQWEAHGKHTALSHYTFIWKPPRSAGLDGELAARGHARALGLGSIFNHNSEPNAGWLCDFAERAIRYVALREIAEGEEVFLCYGGRDALWFDAAPERRTGEEDERREG